MIDALFVRAVEMQMLVATALEVLEPHCVVVGSTEHLYTRLVVLEARRRGIPSVYVPHAPAGLDRAYADIPADLCLLATAGDRDYYEALGAVSDQIEVVGDPVALPVAVRTEGAALKPSVVVFATAVNRPAEGLRSALIDAARWAEGAGLPMVVAAHPRDRTTAARAVQGLGLALHGGRTDELFARSEIALLLTEVSSGIALTAVRAGVPVMRWSGVPMYAFEEKLGIRTLEERDAQILESVSRNREAESVGSTAGAAEKWIGPVGDDAAVARDERLSRAVATAGPTLDSWHLWTR